LIIAPAEKASITVFLIPAGENRQIDYEISALADWKKDEMFNKK
jgi:hypothetical protein